MRKTEYTKNVFANNTFNLEALQNTFQDILLTNFNKLYQTQKSLAGLVRYDFNMSKLKHDKNIFDTVVTMYPRRYTTTLDFEFIPTNLRYTYKNSSLYDKLLNHEIISENPKLFKYNYMVFIDGLYVTTCEVFPYEDKTILSIDIAEGNHTHGIPVKIFNDYMKSDAKVTVLFVPNATVSKFNTNIHMVNKYPDGLDIGKATNVTDINSKSLCFCNTGTTNSLIHPMACTINLDGNAIFSVPKETFTNVSLNINWFNLSLAQDNILGVRHSNPFFKIDTRMPVPTESILVFTKNSDGKLSFNQDITVDLFYPNIYRVNGLKLGEQALIYYSYKDINDETKEVYTNELELYHKYTKDIIKEYTLDTVPQFIKDYKAMDVEYSIDHYNNSIYVPSILSYKINTLQKYIDQDPNILTKYLIYQIGKSTKFYMDMSKIDLSSKIRQDTSNEVPHDILTFDRPHYVFILRTKFTGAQDFELKLFMDGIYLYENDRVIKSDKDYFYIYIPVDKVTNTSMLEINRCKTCTYDKVFTFKTIQDTITLDISNKQGDCLVDDIFIIDKVTKEYIPRTKYFFTMDVQDNPSIEIKPTSNVLVDKPITLYIKDVELLNKPLHIMVRNLSYQEDAIYSNSDMGYKVIHTQSHANNQEGNYRIFRKGRSIPRKAFAFKNCDTFLDDVEIMIKFTPENGENLRIDFSPSNYKTVYYHKLIDEKGFVDVLGKLDKPVNLKWHDIYLDGVKVHKDNIRIISIGKFIIHGINSRKNLEIVENSRDYEILRLKSDAYSIEDKIWDEVGNIKDQILGEYDDIEDTLDDIIKDLIDNAVGDRLEFFEFMMKYTFINPNLKQITEEVKINYSEILEQNGEMFVDANLNKDATVIYEVNANIRSEIMNDVGNKTTNDIGGMADRFAVGALYKSNRDQALPGEMMCDSVTGGYLLKRQDGTIVSIDEITRLNMHTEQAYVNSVYLGYRNKDIIALEFDNHDMPMQVTYDDNILVEGDVQLDEIDKTLVISLDIDTTTVVDKVHISTELIPNIIISYIEDTVLKTIELPVNHLLSKPIKIEGTSITLTSITFKRNTQDKQASTNVILHSILIIK